MTWANRLTMFRMCSVPVFILFLLYPALWSKIAALAVFVLAALSDIWDGIVARSLREVTNWGKFLDPLADKILVSSAFITFVALPDIAVPVWMVIIIISREFIITGLRSLGAAEGNIIAASIYGKFKTTSQMVSIIVILLVLITTMHLNSNPDYEMRTWYSGLRTVLYYLPPLFTFVTTFFTVLSGYHYILEHISLLKQPYAKNNQ